MPGFWLGNTTPAELDRHTRHPLDHDPRRRRAPSTSAASDTTHNQVNPPPATAASDLDNIDLGLPDYGGTRIIINKSISSTQSMASTTGGSPTIIQHGVDFAVSGRLDLFQANEIDGDPLNPPGQFADQVPSASRRPAARSSSRGPADTAPFLNVISLIAGAVTGADRHRPRRGQRHQLHHPGL